VGLIVEKKIGDQVEKGEPLAFVHASDRRSGKEACTALGKAYQIGPNPAVAPPLFDETF